MEKFWKIIENLPDFYTWVQVGGHQKQKGCFKFFFSQI